MRPVASRLTGRPQLIREYQRTAALAFWRPGFHLHSVGKRVSPLPARDLKLMFRYVKPHMKPHESQMTTGRWGQREQGPEEGEERKSQGLGGQVTGGTTRKKKCKKIDRKAEESKGAWIYFFLIATRGFLFVLF